MGFKNPFAVRTFRDGSAPGGAFEFSDSIKTTDATPTNVVLFTPAKSTTKQVKCRINAVKSDGSKGAGWEIAATIRCDSAGTLSLLGASTLSAEADAAFAPTAEINVSGSNIVAILTGIGATTINWSVDAEVI